MAVAVAMVVTVVVAVVMMALLHVLVVALLVVMVAVLVVAVLVVVVVTALVGCVLFGVGLGLGGLDGADVTSVLTLCIEQRNQGRVLRAEQHLSRDLRRATAGCYCSSFGIPAAGDHRRIGAIVLEADSHNCAAGGSVT